jgi:MFS transporter, PPP family, 3-phenylpropionic acid transporter
LLAASGFGIGAAVPVYLKTRISSVELLKLFWEPAARWFFLSAFLMIAAHSTLYVFFSLHLERLGYSKTLIGLLWGVGVMAEILLFRWQNRLFERWSLEGLLAACVFAAGLRFGLIAVVDASAFGLLFCQLLHALTFALHHSACMKRLHEWFGPAAQARAQGAYTVLAYGVGGVLGGLSSTFFWERFGPIAAFFLSSGLAFAGFFAVLVSNSLAKNRKKLMVTDLI